MSLARNLRVAFYSALSKLPGARGRRYARKRQAARKPVVQAAFDAAVKAA